MDKVKVILGYLKKYHFWLLSVVAILCGLIGWMKARGVLDDEYAKNKSTVTGKFTALTGVQQNQNPPNSEWATAIAAITKQEQAEVSTTWKSLYDAQQKVLAWPKVMTAMDGFNTFIENSPPTAEMHRPWLAVYQTEVLKSEFPKLPQIVGAAPLDDSGKPVAASTPAATPSTPPAATGSTTATPTDAPVHYKVQWENQGEVAKWLAFPPGAPPTSFQVRLRQEDYWVFQALLNIIRATNDPAPYVPWIKQIDKLAIGAEAAPQFALGMGKGHVMSLAPADASAEAAAPPPVDAAAAAVDPTQPPQPDLGRYLAADGTILPVGTFQDQQFKRLPIYMKLVMDQREITRLLTECANYPLPVEVRQLRINPGIEKEQGNKSGPAAAAPVDPFDVTLEIHGIIYLFNPPDPVKLGAPPAEGAAPAAAG
jgi:hypothetical protein